MCVSFKCQRFVMTAIMSWNRLGHPSLPECGDYWCQPRQCPRRFRDRSRAVNWTDRGPRPVDRNGHVSASMCTLTPMLKRMLSAVVFPWVVDRQVNKTSIRMKKVGSNRICSKALLSSVHSFSKTISRVAYQSRRNQFKRCLVTDSKTQCNIPRLKWPLSPKTPMF